MLSYIVARILYFFVTLWKYLGWCLWSPINIIITTNEAGTICDVGQGHCVSNVTQSSAAVSNILKHNNKQFCNPWHCQWTVE